MSPIDDIRNAHRHANQLRMVNEALTIRMNRALAQISLMRVEKSKAVHQNCYLKREVVKLRATIEDLRRLTNGARSISAKELALRRRYPGCVVRGTKVKLKEDCV